MKPGKIYGQMSKIMADAEPIAKDRKNLAQGYSFRGIDDVYACLQAVLAKHAVFTTSEILDDRTEERTSAKGSFLIYRILKIRYHFWADDGSSVPSEVIGEGQDSGDKASNKAMSVAHKYALLQAFSIPTQDPKDPENDSPAPSPKPVPRHEPLVETHDKMNREHNKALSDVLAGMGMTNQREWAEISRMLHGKPKSSESLNAVLAKFRGKPDDEGFEVPF